MPSIYQQRARTRKFIYFGLIIALFTVSLLHRQFIIEPQAYALQLRQHAKGEVELTSSATRLAMFGSRGFATAILWHLALEKQKRHQWNELELLVKSITTLQPNFVTPWLFQSWNLAFNVAVQCDRTRDKYFYVSRGMQLLAEGERRHQGGTGFIAGTKKKFPGNPNMRFYMAHYAKQKIGISDEKNAMRCLFELSCIDPLKRDPDNFETTDENGLPAIKIEEFRRFCEDYPRLVRRLRRRLHCRKPQAVIDWLRRNQGVPSRFDEGNVLDPIERKTRLLAPRDQFPVLPPPIDPRITDRNSRDLDKDQESFDVFVLARAWYVYSIEPLQPLPSPPTFGVNEKPFDGLLYRKPKMADHLFRSFPARAQEYIAENLQDEGWFDAQGWLIESWFEDELVVVGRAEKYHSRLAWDKAYHAYYEHGNDVGILLDRWEGYEEKLTKLARKHRNFLPWEETTVIRRKKGLKVTDQNITLAQIAALTPEEKKYFEAFSMLENRGYRTTNSNFREHLVQTGIERLPHIVSIRKAFFEGDELFQAAQEPAAIKKYREAFARWLPTLVHYKDFAKLTHVQKQTCQSEHRYLDLLENQFKDNPALCSDPAMLYAAMAQVGNTHLAHVSPIAVLAAPTMSQLDDDMRKRVFPLRRKTWVLDWVWTYDPDIHELEGRQKVHRILVGLTRGTHPVPYALSPYQSDLAMITISIRQRSNVDDSDWVSLIPMSAIMEARREVRIEKFLRSR